MKLRDHLGVDASHGFLVLKVYGVAHATQEVGGADAVGVLCKEPLVQLMDADIGGKLLQHGIQRKAALSGGEETFFVGVNGGNNNELIKKGGALLHHVQMPEGGRVKTTGVYGYAFHAYGVGGDGGVPMQATARWLAARLLKISGFYAPPALARPASSGGKKFLKRALSMAFM